MTYRSTMVTFGLNVPPYLLGGKIHHHLRSALTNVELVNEIRKNLYVDNLILSGNTPDELAEKFTWRIARESAQKYFRKWV